MLLTPPDTIDDSKISDRKRGDCDRIRLIRAYLQGYARHDTRTRTIFSFSGRRARTLSDCCGAWPSARSRSAARSNQPFVGGQPMKSSSSARGRVTIVLSIMAAASLLCALSSSRATAAEPETPAAKDGGTAAVVVQPTAAQ